MALSSYEDLTVWKKSISLVEDVYRLTKLFPRDELYGLTSQMRRAAVSIPSNIAEGQSRNSTRDFIHFLSISRGSTSELKTQLEIAVRLGYITNEQATSAKDLCDEIGRMLNGLMKALSNGGNF